MSREKILWQVLPREDVASALLSGVNSYFKEKSSHLALGSLGIDAIGVGFSSDRIDSSYIPIAALVVEDECRAEIFSWLKVYAPESFPLSQFTRIISAGDFKRFSANEPLLLAFSRKELHEDRWASLVVGEAIAQGDYDGELHRLPLSRAAGCFTTAVARTHHGQLPEDAINVCIERLSKIERDRRFVRRQVVVEDLKPVWKILKNFTDRPGLDSVDGVVDTILNYLSSNSSLSSRSYNFVGLLEESAGLKSDSIEERVRAFRLLISKIESLSESARRTQECSAIAAIAAFLVGRGTSHEFMLRRSIKLLPLAPIWFGLVAALAGPNFWDMSWGRAAKGIEKQLRTEFSWKESSGYDVCWTEFSWYASTFDNDEDFSSIPKLFSRLISIEIVPGANCQFRIANENRGQEIEQRNENKLDKSVEALLVQLMKLGADAGAIITAQGHLNSYLNKSISKVRPRTKRPKDES